MDHNPELAEFRAGAGGHKDTRGGVQAIERPGGRPNLVWQTRPAAPSDYEERLADALMEAFAQDVTELPDLVARLNADGVPHPDGGAWTVENYTPALERLGA